MLKANNNNMRCQTLQFLKWPFEALKASQSSAHQLVMMPSFTAKMKMFTAW